MEPEVPIPNETGSFSMLDIAFIRSSLLTKTDEEIASLLEMPVETVRMKIQELAGEASDNRTRSIEDQREATQKQQQAKEREKIRKAELDRIEQRREQKRIEKERRLTIEDARRAHRQRDERSKVFKTRKIDFSELISVRLDHKTIVLVKPGTDIEQVKWNYVQHRDIKKQLMKESE
jgi:hypothetical protein